MPHHLGFLLRTRSTSGSAETSMQGPLPMALPYTFMFEVGCCERSTENTTSSAVKAEPSCHFTPWRSLKTQVLGPVCLYSVARQGTIFISLSRVSSCS